MSPAFSTSSVPTHDAALAVELTLRERRALMTQRDWGVLIDRELWPHMTPTDRERARRDFGHNGGSAH